MDNQTGPCLVGHEFNLLEQTFGELRPIFGDLCTQRFEEVPFMFDFGYVQRGYHAPGVDRIPTTYRGYRSLWIFEKPEEPFIDLRIDGRKYMRRVKLLGIHKNYKWVLLVINIYGSEDRGIRDSCKETIDQVQLFAADKENWARMLSFANMKPRLVLDRIKEILIEREAWREKALTSIREARSRLVCRMDDIDRLAKLQPVVDLTVF